MSPLHLIRLQSKDTKKYINQISVENEKNKVNLLLTIKLVLLFIKEIRTLHRTLVIIT